MASDLEQRMRDEVAKIVCDCAPCQGTAALLREAADALASRERLAQANYDSWQASVARIAELDRELERRERAQDKPHPPDADWHLDENEERQLVEYLAQFSRAVK